MMKKHTQFLKNSIAVATLIAYTLFAPFSTLIVYAQTPTPSVNPTPPDSNEPTSTPTPVDWADPLPESSPSGSIEPLVSPGSDTTTPTATVQPTLTPTFTPTATPFDEPTYTPTPTFTTTPTAINQSATIRRPILLRPLTKRQFRGNERILLTVDNILGNETSVSVTHQNGQSVNAQIRTEIINDTEIITVLPSVSFTPGKYTVRVTDSTGAMVEQDFLWGVLAINTNKSMYSPGETARLAIAVLDESGSMVCDAGVTLGIRDPSGAQQILTTTDGTIIVNPECHIKDKTVKPDYEAVYQTRGIGSYQMTLSAQTKNGNYSISDYFEVREVVPFDIERNSATRIFPPRWYEMTLSITANQDFTGEMVETVPESFTIINHPDTAIQSADAVRVVSRTDSTIESAVLSLAYPFTGIYDTTLGFGENLKDPALIDIYRRYGLVGHDGIDFGLPIGTPVSAVDEGTVILAGEGAYGTTVAIQHRWGRSYYGHLSSIAVSLGQKVAKGDNLALSGDSGLTTGPHLHFSMKLNTPDMTNGYFGKVDPLPFLTSVATVSDVSVKQMIWNVSVKKGDHFTIGYGYKTPMTSPQFYLMGPMVMKETGNRRPGTGNTGNDPNNPFVLGAASGGEVFREIRQWQLAIDVTVTFEQQLNIIDQIYTTTSTTDAPDDNSLGLVTIDATKLILATFYFDAVIKNANASTTTTATLYDNVGNAVSGGTATTTSTTYVRSRSSAVALSGTYTVRLKTSNASNAATMIAARIIAIQSSTALQKSETPIELGNNETISSTSYGELSNPKYYYYDSAKYPDLSTATLEASVKGDTLQGAGRYWTSGFEMNSTTAGVEMTSTAGTMSIVTSPVRSGTYAFRANPTSSTGLYTARYLTSADANNYLRFYVRYATAPSALTYIASFYTSTTHRAGIRMATDGSLELWNATAKVGSSSSALSANTWYRVELRYDSTAAAGSDTLDAHLNGTSFASSSAESLGTINSFQMGVITSTTADLFFDDVAINNATGSWIGPGQVVHLFPNAAGDSAQWTIGGSSAAATNHEGVDEVTPNDATDLNYSNTSSQTDYFNVSDAALASSDDVNVVTVGVRYAGVGASSNARFRVGIKSAASGTIETGSNITPNSATWRTDNNNATTNPTLFVYDLPGSSTTKWTDATLDSAQIGYEMVLTSTNASQISALFMVVDYTANADLASDSSVAAQVKLQQCDESSCSWTDVTSSTITSSAMTWQRIVSSTLTLTTGRRYRISISKSASGGTVKIANAKLLLSQSTGRGGGLTDIELVHQSVNTLATDTDSTYTDQEYLNQFDPASFAGGTFAYFYEATIKTSAGTGYAKLKNDTGADEIDTPTTSEVSTTSTSYTRARSSAIGGNSDWPSSAANLDTVVKNSAASGNTTSVANSWLIIQISSLGSVETATLAQLMRHGKWFNSSGVEQPFTF